jgi:hypothetical protein
MFSNINTQNQFIPFHIKAKKAERVDEPKVNVKKSREEKLEIPEGTTVTVDGNLLKINNGDQEKQVSRSELISSYEVSPGALTVQFASGAASHNEAVAVHLNQITQALTNTTPFTYTDADVVYSPFAK